MLDGFAQEKRGTAVAVVGDDLPDLFITNALGERRRVRRHTIMPDRFLVELAVTASADPAEAIPRLVAMAQELTGATSAGLSILDSEAQPQVFRWKHLHGVLANFEGTFTPRDYSPCGTTLDQGRPLLCKRPERYFKWVAEAGVSIAEVMLVPLRWAAPDSSRGTLWVVAPGENYFDADDARILEDVASFAAEALQRKTRG